MHSQPPSDSVSLGTGERIPGVVMCVHPFGVGVFMPESAAFGHVNLSHLALPAEAHPVKLPEVGAELELEVLGYSGTGQLRLRAAGDVSPRRQLRSQSLRGGALWAFRCDASHSWEMPELAPFQEPDVSCPMCEATAVTARRQAWADRVDISLVSVARMADPVREIVAGDHAFHVAILDGDGRVLLRTRTPLQTKQALDVCREVSGASAVEAVRRGKRMGLDASEDADGSRVMLVKQPVTRTTVVSIDPFEALDGLGCVIVRRRTGVSYQQQYGGTRCLQGIVEGYLVPVDLSGIAEDLNALFVDELGGSGLGVAGSRPTELLDRLGQLASRVVMAASDKEGVEASLRLDPGRHHEIDEAWLPVLTPDGPGVLVWQNSD